MATHCNHLAGVGHCQNCCPFAVVDQNGTTELDRLRAEIAQLTLARDAAVNSFTFNYKRANDAEAEVARLKRERDEASEAAKDLAAKLKFALDFVHVTEGFTFPDGDHWDAGKYAMEYCPLRALATQLMWALRTGVEFVENGAPNEHFMEWVQQARAAIAAAEKFKLGND